MSTSSLAAFSTIDSNRATDLVTEMMAIPGKSGQERQVVEYITQRLREAGISDQQIIQDGAHRKSPRGGEVGNVIVKLPGTRRGARRLLMAHIDTVPLCVGARPIRKGEWIHSQDAHTGLGGDNRAGASVVLNTILEIVRQELPHPPLTLLWPVQEEVGLLGARYVARSKLGNPKRCFNWDGGAPNLAVIGATGDVSMDIEIQGVPSHAGAHPEQGVSAVAIAGLAIAELVRNGWHGLVIKGQNSGSSNIGIISGGEATNVVTPQVRLRAEARSHDPEFREQIVEAFRRAFEQAAVQLRNDAGQSGRVRFDSELKYESFRLSEDEPCIRSALAAIAAAGLEPGTRICNGGLDANWMTAHGFPTVTLGCGQQEIHTAEEKLHVGSYLDACRIALLLATAAV